jgi:hypothetical protein
LDFEVERDTSLAFGDILADVLTSDVVWTVCDFRCENAGGVGGEDGGVRFAGGIVVNTSLVVVNCFVDFEGCKVTAELLGSWVCLLVWSDRGEVEGERTSLDVAGLSNSSRGLSTTSDGPRVQLAVLERVGAGVNGALCS